jgi:hypothetical protein
MNRSFWTPLILTAGVCAVVMVALATHNKRLSDQLAAGQQGPPGQPPARPGKSDRTPSPPLSSAEKTERATEGVKRFIASLVPAEGSRAKELAKGSDLLRGGNEEDAGRRIMFWQNLPDLLRSVEGLSVDELLAVAADLPVPERTSMGGSSEFLYDTRAHLVMLAAEQDPMRVLQDEKLMEGLEEFAVLRCLAMVDPAAAARLIPERVPPEDQEDRERLGALMLGSDFERGLALLLEMRVSDPDREDGMKSLTGGLGQGSIPLRSGVARKLEQAMSDPKFGAIRNDLIKTTLDHHLTESGVGEAARQAEAMALTPEEINLYLDSVGKELIATEPKATLEWMGKALTTDQQLRDIPKAVVQWADQDMNAATDWLDRQESSPVRDRAIASFATEASELDAEGAAVWAEEIQDKQLRAKTLRRIKSRQPVAGEQAITR